MLSRKIAITLLDGCCAGSTGEFRSPVTFARTWDADITLLEADGEFDSATLGIHGFRRPELTLIAGGGVTVGSSDLSSADGIVLENEQQEIVIGGQKIEIKYLPLFRLSTVSKAGHHFASRRKMAMVSALLITVFSAGSVGIAASFSGGNALDASRHAAMAPKFDFWSEVSRQSAERFVIELPVMQQQLRAAGLDGLVELEYDAAGRIYTLSGQLPSHKSQAVAEFVDWHGRSGDANVLIDRVSFTDNPVEQPPAITMVMGSEPPALFFGNDKKVRLGETGPDNWFYDSYQDGIVTLTRGNTKANVIVFKTQ